jgi:hypothetical protein
MKTLIIILALCLQNIVQAQDSLLIEYVSTSSKIPFRNQPMPHRYQRQGIDTVKSTKVDYYYPYIFLHKDSAKIKDVSYGELKKMQVLTKKQLLVHLDKISEKERIEHKEKLDKMTPQERMSLPEPYPNKAEEKKEKYLMSKPLYLVIKDNKKQRAKIIPVRYIPEIKL